MEPIIRLDPEERRTGQLAPETLEAAKARFERFGYLQVDEAFEKPFVFNLLRSYIAHLGAMDFTKLSTGSLNVGDKRFMISLPMEGAFADPALYASPALLALFEAILGPDLVLNSYASVAAFPGAEAQHIHADHPPLFPESALSAQLPTSCLTLIVPLIDLDDETGSTAILDGSHRLMPDDPGLAALEPYKPHPMPMGSVVFFDYRVLHHGTPNVSEFIRPILSLVYSRPWFHDSRNFMIQKPLEIPRSAYEQVPEAHRGLLARAAIVEDAAAPEAVEA